jgi:hypothetical protein
MATREEQRREHNEQKELESLRRVFESLDKNKDGKVDFKELNDQLIKLDYRAKRVEVEDMIWEVDEDCDHCVSWDEFKLMFHRCRSDKVGPCVPVRPALVPRSDCSHRRRTPVFSVLADWVGAAQAVQCGGIHDARQGLVGQYRHGRVHGDTLPPLRQGPARAAHQRLLQA